MFCTRKKIFPYFVLPFKQQLCFKLTTKFPKVIERSKTIQNSLIRIPAEFSSKIQSLPLTSIMNATIAWKNVNISASVCFNRSMEVIIMQVNKIICNLFFLFLLHFNNLSVLFFLMKSQSKNLFILYRILYLY